MSLARVVLDYFFGPFEMCPHCGLMARGNAEGCVGCELLRVESERDEARRQIADLARYP